MTLFLKNSLYIQWFCISLLIQFIHSLFVHCNRLRTLIYLLSIMCTNGPYCFCLFRWKITLSWKWEKKAKKRQKSRCRHNGPVWSCRSFSVPSPSYRGRWGSLYFGLHFEVRASHPKTGRSFLVWSGSYSHLQPNQANRQPALFIKKNCNGVFDEW